MSGTRQELQEALCRYTTDTVNDMNTVCGFCEGISAWKDARKTELSKLEDIKDKADKVDLKFSHVTKSEEKFKALGEYLKSKVTSNYADSRRAELKTELSAVLTDTLRGFEELDHFLEAVEKLPVTSLHVFMEENQVLHLPGGISLEHVRIVITAARQICPLLLEFKRDASVFFLPKLQNVEVLSYQLDKYTETTRTICEELEKSQRLLMTKKHLADLSGNLSEDDILGIASHINQHFELRPHFQRTATETVVDLDVDLSEDEIQRMLDHINQLHKIRMDQNFRLVFLFQEVSCSGFIDEFKERQPRMLQFLTDLEGVAVQLDKMNKGAKISSVSGSSVSAVGGVLSIVGLALIPVTAGVSLGLTIGGTALGITSGVNSVVTTATEIGVNCTQQKKANVVFQSFMEDVQSLQDCLEKVSSQPASKIKWKPEWAKLFTMGCAVVSVRFGVKSLIEDVSALNSLKTENFNAGAPNGAMVASNIPQIGQAAAKGSLALSKTARASVIGLNTLFLGMDILSICKVSNSLHKGSETEDSKFIRARASLWSSEMDSWKKIHDSLCKGQKTSEEHRAVLDETFYPEKEVKKNESLYSVPPPSKNEHAVLDNPSDPEKEIKKNESLSNVLPPSKNENAVLDNPSDPEKETKKNESLCNVLPPSKNEHAVLDNPSDPEKEIKKNESLSNVLPPSKNEHAVLDNPSDPEKEIKKNESLSNVLPPSKNEHAVLDNPSYPEKEIKKNESLCNVLPPSKNEHAVLDKPSDPEMVIKKNESFSNVLPPSKNEHGVLDNPSDPEKEIKKNESLCNVLPPSKNEHAVLDKPSDPEMVIKKNESFSNVLPPSKNEHGVLDKTSDPEKEIKKNESLSNVLPPSKNEHAFLDNPSDPEKEIKKNESPRNVLLPSKNEHAVLDNPSDPEKEIKQNESPRNVLSPSTNEHAVLDNPSDPEKEVKRKESFQMRMVNSLWMENKIVMRIVIVAIAVVATLIYSH